MFVNFNILNQLGSPAINSNTFANRPAAGQTGRLFVSTDTYEIYRDNGTTWDLIGGPGTSTITGSGTATQVAYFTSSQAIGSSANLFWDNTNTRLGVGTATPGAALDVHSTGTIAQLNSTGATNNGYLAFQRAGTTTFSIGDTYNGGTNYFRIFGQTLGADIIQIFAATGKTQFQATQTYSTGLARANYFDYNLSVAGGGSFSSPNSISAVGATLDLTLAGNATIPSGARSGLDAYNTVSFTGTGTLTHSQGTQIRAYSNLTTGWAFAGSATGTITHLAGLRVLFPDNSGSAVTITNNYGLLINDQTANTGTVTYTNRWGIYQEGASDLNYLASNLLIKSTVNNGNALQVTGNGNLSGDMTADSYYLNGMTAGNGALYWTSDRVTLANYNASGIVTIETGGGTAAATFLANQNVGIGLTPNVKLEVASRFRVSEGGFQRYFDVSEATVKLYGSANPSIKFGDFNSGLDRTATIGFESNYFGRGSIDFTVKEQASGTGITALSLAYTGAATFSSSVTTGGSVIGYLAGLTAYRTYTKAAQFEISSYQSASGSPYTKTMDIVSNADSGVASEMRFLTAASGSNPSTALTLGSSGAATFSSSVTTGTPTGGTAAAWKLGSRVATSVTLDTTQYIEVDIGGTAYKLAIVTPA